MLFIVFLLSMLSSVAYAESGSDFVGSAVCGTCHVREYQQWQGSHHQLAMQKATAQTVLGDFDDARFVYNGIETRFHRRGDHFFVTTDGEDGKLHEFPVEWVFGVYPLQQYLLPLSGGRLQALSIAWDARPANEGGQRWYHLYPDQRIDYRDPLHWTGVYQNWNTNCAECHTTDFQKNYDAKTDSYHSRFAEDTVGCEACHGPGLTHQKMALAGTLSAENKGLSLQLNQRGSWAFLKDSSIAAQLKPPQHKQQLNTCARCHSRRGVLGDYHYGADLLDTHRMALPVAPLYHPDGQILDEVYVYGSFLQSKMHAAGVVCSNCHEPHSLKLRAPGNAVCAQCHLPTVYDTEAHSRHKRGSSGAQCANCHMPETTYMGVDPRRDHSFRIPRPDLSEKLGTPNACNQCHTDKTPQWATASLREWGVTFPASTKEPAVAFAQAARGDQRAVPALAALASDRNAAVIWRASAMEALGGFGSREAWSLAQGFLSASDSLLRLAAVRSLDYVPLARRYQLLRQYLKDDVTSVRMAMAERLAAVPLEQLNEQQRSELLALFSEYERIQRQNAEIPGVQLQLADFYRQRGDLVSAEASYARALELNPQLIPARLNYADLKRALGRDSEARELLQQALTFAPDNGPVLYALGLLETRTKNRAKALEYLRRAATAESSGVRYRYVYAIALHDSGKPNEAIAVLTKALESAPQDQSLLVALANWLGEMGRSREALAYSRILLDIAPKNRRYQMLNQKLLTINPENYK